MSTRPKGKASHTILAHFSTCIYTKQINIKSGFHQEKIILVWLLKFTPPEFSRAHTTTILFYYYSGCSVVPNKYCKYFDHISEKNIKKERGFMDPAFGLYKKSVSLRLSSKMKRLYTGNINN